MRKTLNELKTINDRNLLAYYKAERSRFYQNHSKYVCDCCGQFSWEIDTSEIKLKEEYDLHVQYLKFITRELNSRGHVTSTKIRRPLKKEGFHKKAYQIR